MGDGGTGDAGGMSGTNGMPPEDPDVLARAAVVLGSCYGPGVAQNAAKLWHWRERTDYAAAFHLQAACIADAGGGCRALEECLGWRIVEANGCHPGTYCDDGVVTYCPDEQIEEILDCRSIGLDCETNSGCVDPLAEDCVPLPYVPNCEADELHLCEGGKVARYDCGEHGLVCREVTYGNGTRVAHCAGAGEACFDSSTYDGIVCNGDTLEACVNGWRQDRDCTSVVAGFSCQTVDDFPFCGLAAECVPGHDQYGSSGSPEPTCDGTFIEFCNAGRLERIDCTALGFEGCGRILNQRSACIPGSTAPE